MTNFVAGEPDGVCARATAPSVTGEEACFLHQLTVAGLPAGKLLGKVGAGHDRLIERPLDHQRFPLRRVAHLLEHVDVLGNPIRRCAGRLSPIFHQFVGWRGLGGCDLVARSLVRRVRVDPQHELVERHQPTGVRS